MRSILVGAAVLGSASASGYPSVVATMDFTGLDQATFGATSQAQFEGAVKERIAPSQAVAVSVQGSRAVLLLVV